MPKLVAQIVAMYRPNKDKVTIVATLMLSITCKPANLVRVFVIENLLQILLINLAFIYLDFLLMDLEQYQVPPEDIVFLFVGKTTQSEVVNYDLWKIIGRELLEVFSSREQIDCLEELDFSRLSRQFVNVR